MSEVDWNTTMALDSFENQTLTMAFTTEAPSSGIYPYGVHVAKACAWIIIAVLGIVGNAMIILSAVLSEHVRTTTNVLVINLSVADLWTCLSLPWSCVSSLSDGVWPLASEVPCEIAAFMWNTGLGASLYNLALIAVNRLIKITRPLATYNRIFSPRNMVFIVFLSWFIPTFVIVFPLTLGVGALGHDIQNKDCTDKDAHPRGNDYNLAQTIGLYPIPMITVIISYVIIYVHVRRYYKKQLSINKSAGPSRSTDAVVEPSVTNMPSMSTTSVVEIVVESSDDEESTKGDGSQEISRQQLQITKNLFLVFCAFSLCVSPYFISLFVAASEKFATFGATLLLCNTCVDPIIYAVQHPQFKKVLRPMGRCKWRKIPQPSWTLQAILSLCHRETNS